MINNQKIYYIYFILNKINNRIYVGKTIYPERRFIAHCRSKQYIGHAIRKYKRENFEFYIITDTLSKEESSDIEIFYIKHWKTTQKEFGYNISSGGEGGNPLEGANEERKKIKSEKIRKANLGKKDSRETRKKKSLVHSGENNSMFGKKHTEESKRKNSQSQLGEKHWRSVKFTNDEKEIIIENKNNGVSGRKIAEILNFKFNKNLTSKPIYRFLRNNK
jgi:group I intron endonuclease